MSGRVEAVVALSVENTWIRTVLDEQIDDLHQAVPRSVLQRRSDRFPTNRVDVRTQLDEICARLESVINRSPVQWRDAIVVSVRRACPTRLDKSSDQLGPALLRGSEDVELYGADNLLPKS
jgi:hypothetical protein